MSTMSPPLLASGDPSGAEGSGGRTVSVANGAWQKLFDARGSRRSITAQNKSADAVVFFFYPANLDPNADSIALTEGFTLSGGAAVGGSFTFEDRSTIKLALWAVCTGAGSCDVFAFELH